MKKLTRGQFLGRTATTLAAALGVGSLPACNDDRGAQGASGSAPDLVLTNGKVYTVDDQMPQAEAFAIKGGRFIAVGSNDDIRDLAGNGTQVIDAEGMTVIPGFIDAHTHPANGGIREMTYVHLDLPTNAEVLEALRKRAAETPPNQWILGFKYEETKVREGRPLTRREIDEAVPNHPVRFTPRSGHVAWYNSKAFELAGITANSSAPPVGRIYKDENGELNGQVAGPANGPLTANIPEISTREQRQAAVKLISEMMTASGLTSVHDAGANFDELVAYQDSLAAGEMKFRVYSLFRPPVYTALKAAGIRTGFGDDWLRLGPVKYTSDGAASNRTMLMSQPYVGRPDDFGVEYMTAEEIMAAADDAFASGYRIGIHANGDVAIDRVLDAYEAADRKYPNQNLRPRIEHCSLVSPGSLARIKALNAIPTPFWSYVYWHGGMFQEYGQERMKWMFAHKSMLDAGIPVPGASDYVPGPYQPLMALQSMVTRIDYAGRPWGVNQKVSVDEALRIGTINGAYAAFEENIKGSITAGKLGDFVMLAEDPHTAQPDKIKDIQVVRTVVGGKTMHEA